jgi:hypothetical protein
MIRATVVDRQNAEGHARRMTDAELRTYQFIHNAPETVEGYATTKPDAEAVPRRILFKYIVPHAKGSRAGMIWCSHCQERNHFDGSLVEYTDHVRRTVGRCCRSKHCGELEALLEEFDDHYVRRLHLDQFDKIGRVLPDVLEEVPRLLASSVAVDFQTHRKQFADSCEALFNFLYRAIIDDGGILRWEVSAADYSRTALDRERVADDNEGPRGKRVVRLHRKYQIQGGELFNVNFTPLSALTKVRDTLQQTTEFYYQSATDQIDGEEFRYWKRALGNAADLLERVQRTLFAIPAFYQLENRSVIVAIRNGQMRDAAYSVTNTGIVWNPPDADAVTIEPPRDYAPMKFRTIARLRRVIR